MYEDFFGFDRRPFSLTPDPDFLYWTGQHRRAFDMICLSLLRQAPISVITGDVGAGKTTLLHALLREISGVFEVGLLSNVVGDSGDLLRWILTAFGEEGEPSTRAEATREVEALLRRFREEGRRSVLIIDEAQNVSDHGIETLRLLTNVDIGKSAPLSLIVAGQPQLRDRIAGPAFSAFRQRLGASFHLGPMTLEETEGYVRNRIEIAGGEAELLDSGAIEAVYRRAGGVPRLTNLLCDVCLVAAFGADRPRVDADFAESALAERLALGGLGGLPAETAEPVTMKRAASAGRTRVHVAPRDAAIVWPAGTRPSAAPPSLRLVTAEAEPHETELALLLTERMAVSPDAAQPEANGTGEAPKASPVTVEPAPRGGSQTLRRALGSVAGLAVAASVAGVALILPATGTDGGQRAIAGTSTSLASTSHLHLAAVATPAAPSSALGVVEAVLAPPDPQAAERLFEVALDEAALNPTAAAIAYARAAARGHGRAAYYLAQMYETGDGVPFAPGTAWNWYAFASKEVPGAEERLDELAVAATVDIGAAAPVFAAVDARIVELVWQGRGAFAVELAASPDAAEVVHETSLTAVRLQLPPGVGWWRVSAIGAEPSEWIRLDTVPAY